MGADHVFGDACGVMEGSDGVTNDLEGDGGSWVKVLRAWDAGTEMGRVLVSTIIMVLGQI